MSSAYIDFIITLLE